MQRRRQTRISAILPVALALLALGCVKTVKFKSQQLAGKGTATVKVALTFDRNNILQVKLSNVADPSTLKPSYTRYVLWAATPDRKTVTNIGQLRVDEKKNAAIQTLTPMRSFILFITAETAGDATTPGPDVIFEASRTDW